MIDPDDIAAALVERWAWASTHARRSLQAAGLPSQQVLATLAPLSTLRWRMVAMDGPRC